MKVIDYLTTILVSIIMITLTLAVGLMPLFAVAYFNLPEWEFAARLFGCLIAIPMLRLTFNVIDKLPFYTHRS